MSSARVAASPSPTAEKCEDARCARDRIFDTARELFYRQGIRAVGVETIAKEAGATKMSLYRHFPSKDELTAQCLEADRLEFNEWWDSVMSPHAGNPRKQLEALFQAFQSKTCGDDDESRGCPLANAAVELADRSHPGWKVVFEHKSDVRERLQQLCREMKARNPRQLGDALLLLMEGAYMARLVFDLGGPVQSVSKTAKVLIEDQLS